MAHRFGLIGLILLASVSASVAAQYRTVTDNSVVTADISRLETNRIVLEGDRIKRFIRASGAMRFDHDADTGDLYVTIDGDMMFRDDLLSLFVVGESGATYHLKLRPRDIPSEQIFLTNYELGQKAVGVSAGAPRHAELSAFVRQLIRGEAKGRLRKVKLTRAQKRDKEKIAHKFGDGGHIKAIGGLQELWLGARWEGRIYKIVAADDNEGAMYLKPAQFRPAAAVWIARSDIPPGGSSEVLIVQERKKNKGGWQ